MHPNVPGTGEAVVLFDGVCNLCNGAVDFLIRRDPESRLRFAALQSEAGTELLSRHGLPGEPLSSVVVISRGRVYTRSSAALEVARYLRGRWRWLRVLRIVPRPIRDALYDAVARSRYRVFGRRDECMIPTPELNRRFL